MLSRWCKLSKNWSHSQSRSLAALWINKVAFSTFNPAPGIGTVRTEDRRVGSSLVGVASLGRPDVAPNTEND